MLFLDEVKEITIESELYKHIVKIRDNLEKMIDVQYAKRETLTQVLDEIANIDEINMEDTQELLSVIEDIRNILSRINYNIEGIKELIEDISGVQDRLDNIIDHNVEDNLLKKDIEYFYILYIEKTNMIEDTNLSYENIIIRAYKFIFLLVSKLNGEKQSKEIIEKLVNSDKALDFNNKQDNVDEKNMIEDNSVFEIEEKEEDIIEDIKKENNQIFKSFKIESNIEDSNEVEANENEEIIQENMESQEIVQDESKINDKENICKEKIDEKDTCKEMSSKEDNCEKMNDKINACEDKINKEESTKNILKDNKFLIISQVQNKVFLPYKVSDLKRKYNEKRNKFSSIQDMISSEYVVPLNKYKNPVIARFKEAYSLMRDKEDATFSEALDLALEVTFKSNLNPAVITACNNLSELDQFLDCLEENKLDKFNIFKVEYEGLPSIK